MKPETRPAAAFRSPRLRFDAFTIDDAPEVYACITPGITRYMRWDPPPSYEAFRDRRSAELLAQDGSDRSFVVRHGETLDCLGVTAVDGVAAPMPEIGLWLRADVHGRGFGTEVVAAVIAWAATHLHRTAFDYPVAVDNVASRRIAERLGGVIVGQRTTAKYRAVVYRIAAPAA